MLTIFEEMVLHGCSTGCKFASDVSIFVYFSVSNFFLCASPVTTFLELKHCFHYYVTSYNYGDSRAKDYSEQLPNSIFTSDVNRRYYMLLLFLFVLFLFFCLFFVVVFLFCFFFCLGIAT